MIPIPGKFSKLYFSEYNSTAGYGISGCTISDSLQLNTEMLEITSPTDNYVNVLPTYKSGSINVDSLLITTVGGDPQIASSQMISWHQDNEKLDFTYEYTDGINTYTIGGACYITSLSITGASNDFATLQISLQITGAWQLNF